MATRSALDSASVPATLIVAASDDVVAQTLTSLWDGTHLVTPLGLSKPGWRYDPARADASRVVTHDGALIDARDVRGVYVRLSHVRVEDLQHIVEHDRAYVAAEMTAFLLAWLTQLSCPVVNRPVPYCLAGPCWRPERWARTAAKLAIPVRSVRRDSADNAEWAAPSAPIGVTVIGDRWFGEMTDLTGEQAVQLARAADADVLYAIFEATPASTPQFVTAHVWPDLTTRAAIDGLHDLVSGR